MSRQLLWLPGVLLCCIMLPVQAQNLIALDDSYGIPFGQPLQVEASGVMDNDTLDGEPAGENGATAVWVSGPSHGALQCPSDIQLALCPDGSFDYTPDAGFPGSDSFDYLAVAGTETSAATVTLTACNGGPQIFDCWHESAYLSLLIELGYASYWESFEGDAWDAARSPVAIPSITNKGITWTSNFPLDNDITTGTGPARTGLYGVFDPQHGFATGTPLECDVDVPPPNCLFHDGFRGSRVPEEAELHGIGGFITGTSGNSVSIILDDIFNIPFGRLPGNQHQFIGVIDAGVAGFRRFEIRELDGKVGQKELIWGDDFTLVIVPPPNNTPPVANAGLSQAVLVNDTVVLDGSGSSDVDGDPLSYRWSFESLPEGSYAELDTTDPIHPDFVTDVAGSYVLRLIVNDSMVDSAPDTVEITAGCSGEVVVVSNATVPPGITECVASISITAGPNILVVAAAELWLFAPNVSLESGVTVETGGVLRINPNP